MTDEELQHIKRNGIMLKDAVYIVDKLIADVQQARKERDWLAQRLAYENCCTPNERKEKPAYCLEHSCKECGLSSKNAWHKAAKEATK